MPTRQGCYSNGCGSRAGMLAGACMAWQQVVSRAPGSGRVRRACHVWFLATRGSVEGASHPRNVFGSPCILMGGACMARQRQEGE